MSKHPKPAPGPFAFIGALLPLVYFGGMIYYFSGVGGGTIQGIVDIGLGPTVAGLTIVGLLFTIQPLVMIFRLFFGTPSTARQGASASSIDAASDTGFDADDAIARYLAKRGTGDAEPLSSMPSADTPTPQPPRAGFGRKAL